LYCQQCEKLIEFHSDELREIRDAVARENRFRVLGHRFIVQGICEDCARPRRPKRPVDMV
jgi:Fur family ferric uptake transcriptional regulator